MKWYIIPKPHTILIVLLITCVYSCATRPERIKAKKIDSATYLSWSCDQLDAEQLRLGKALTLASDEQRSDRQADTLGWILVGIPMGGGHKEAIAELIGKLDSVQETMLRKNCSSPLLEIGELIKAKRLRELEAKE